jgi:RND family efflux transporter MFP subunit
MLLISGCSKKQGMDAAASETAPEFSVSVKVAPVVRSNIKSTIHAVGMIKALNQAKISAKIPGKVERVFFDVGDRVKAGCSLLQLEKIDLELAVRQAEAAVQMAEANHAKAKLDWERARELLDKGICSQQQFDLAKSGFEVADASVNQAKANLELARNQLDNTEVTTLIGGTVTNKYVDLGERVAPGQPLFEIAEIKRVEVEVGVSDKLFAEIKLGQTATVSVDGFTGPDFKGKIKEIQPSIDPMTRTFKVTIGVDNPRELLKPGMFARATIEVGSHSAVLIIPKAATIEEEGKFYAVAVRNGKADKVEIVPGFRDGDQVEALSGLSDGDQVVIEGAYGLAKGAAVRISGE